MEDDRPRRVTVLEGKTPARAADAGDAVARAVAAAGMTAIRFTLGDELEALSRHVNEVRPDLVFNLVEELAGSPGLTPDVAAALELVGVAYTGAGPAGLHIARDQNLLGRLLVAHAIPLTRPVPGKDVAIAIVGNETPLVLTASHDAEPLASLALATATALRFRDYGLVVARREGARAVVARASANPSLDPEGELARAARAAGMSYEELIGRIIDEAWRRRVEAGRSTEASIS